MRKPLEGDKLLEKLEELAENPANWNGKIRNFHSVLADMKHEKYYFKHTNNWVSDYYWFYWDNNKICSCDDGYQLEYFPYGLLTGKFIRIPKNHPALFEEVDDDQPILPNRD